MGNKKRTWSSSSQNNPQHISTRRNYKNPQSQRRLNPNPRPKLCARTHSTLIFQSQVPTADKLCIVYKMMLAKFRDTLSTSKPQRAYICVCNNFVQFVGKEELGSEIDLEDFLAQHNLTDKPEYRCLGEGILAGPPPEAEGGLYCEHDWDTLLCWPATPAGQLASQSCFDELNGIRYDTSRE